MYCPKCGTQIPDDSIFCTECGEKLDKYGLVTETAETPDIYDDLYRKPPEKKKSRLPVILAVTAVVVVLAVAALFVFGERIFKGGNGKDAIVFLEDGDYEYMTEPKKDAHAKLTESGMEDYSYMDLVRFSPDGKYVYMMKNYDSSKQTFDLCRAECAGISGTSDRNGEHVETVAPNVRYHAYEYSRSAVNWPDNASDYEFVTDDEIIYADGKDSLYYFDGREKKRIAKNVSLFYVFDDTVIYLVYDNDANDITVYGWNVHGKEDPQELIGGAANALVYGPDNVIVLMPGDFSYDNYNNPYFQEAYRVGMGVEKEKIGSNVCFAGAYDNGKTLFFTEPSGKDFYLTDYLTDGALENLSYSAYGDLEKPQNELTLFAWTKNGKDVIERNVFTASVVDNGIFYTKTEDLSFLKLEERQISEETGSSASAVIDAMVFRMNGYLYLYGQDDIVKLSEDAMEMLADDQCSRYNISGSLYVDGNGVYLNLKDLDLYYADFKNGAAEDFQFLHEDASLCSSGNGKLYFNANESRRGDNSYVDLYSCTDGKEKLIAEDILSGSWSAVYEDGTVLAYTGMDSNYRYTLSLFADSPAGEELAEHVSGFCRMDTGEIFYIAGEDLYVYKNKNAERIADNVTAMFHKNNQNETLDELVFSTHYMAGY